MVSLINPLRHFKRTDPVQSVKGQGRIEGHYAQHIMRVAINYRNEGRQILLGPTPGLTLVNYWAQRGKPDVGYARWIQ
jgi:hypothetical protein